jgi:hypothetical protein
MYSAYLLLWTMLSSRYPVGKNVYSSDWDLLVVLDACRIDALRAVAPEYDFIGEVPEITSVGSTSLEWVLKTFTHEHLDEIRQTRYVSTNGHLGQLAGDDTDYFAYGSISGTKVAESPWSNRFVERNAVAESDFAGVEHLYHLTENNPYGGTPLPSDVTDVAIRTGREHDPERLAVHYMQPHAPYLRGALERGYIKEYESSPFAALRAGESRERVWEAYLDNLRLVLESVERLLNNVNAEKVVITADHGDLFGEWGLYSHIAGVFHPDLKRVPWVETTATDSKEFQPELVETESEDVEGDAQKQLEALGYV